MDQLKGDRGFTLIEVLVSMVILGILTTLTVLFINTFFSNPMVLFRAEALNIAKGELNRCIENKLENDTTFTSGNGSLLIERKIVIEERLTTVNIIVTHKPTERKIINLDRIYKND